MTSQWRHGNKTHSCYLELNCVHNLYFRFFIFWKLTELCRFVTYLWDDHRSIQQYWAQWSVNKESLAKSKLSRTNNVPVCSISNLSFCHWQLMQRTRRCHSKIYIIHVVLPVGIRWAWCKSGKRNVKRNTNARCLQIQHCVDFEMK